MQWNIMLLETGFLKQMQTAILVKCKGLSGSVSRGSQWGKIWENSHKDISLEKSPKTAWNTEISSVKRFVFAVNFGI